MLEQDKYHKEDEAEMLKVACKTMSNGLDVIDVVKLVLYLVSMEIQKPEK